MTLDEAKKIDLIVGTADHGCSVCVGNLVDQLNAEFPEFVWKVGGEGSPDPENGGLYVGVSSKGE